LGAEKERKRDKKSKAYHRGAVRMGPKAQWRAKRKKKNGHRGTQNTGAHRIRVLLVGASQTRQV